MQDVAYISYDDVLAGNIRAARAQAKLSQDSVVERMRHLGYENWHRQTLSKIEGGTRRVLAREVVGLALVLETTLPSLLGPGTRADDIELPGGQRIGAVSLERLAGRGSNDHAVQWAGTNEAAWATLRPVSGTDVFARGEQIDADYQRWLAERTGPGDGGS